MQAELAAARAHPAVVASIVVAAVAVTAAALVAIAYMLGWLPARAALPTPVGMASPAQQAAGTASDVALLPGETVVSPPEAQKPAATAPTTPRPTTPSYVKPQASSAKPAKKAAAALPKTASASARSYCVNCGTIASVIPYGRGEWDVRVRFQDGSSETLRYREPPGLRAGERVRLEDGRLVRE